MSIDKIKPEDYMSDAEWDKQIDSLASNQQVGGDHYKDLAISPVDYIYANSLSWSIGNVIKLVTRKKFDPVEDLLKAKHYIDLELYIDRDLLNDLKVFAKANSKCHQNIAEYALKLLIHSNNQKVQLDVDSL